MIRTLLTNLSDLEISLVTKALTNDLTRYIFDYSVNNQIHLEYRPNELYISNSDKLCDWKYLSLAI